MFKKRIAACVILLQTSPQKMKGAISKCLREASTIEGVLECQKCNVWSVGYGLGSLVGTLHVRVAEDANEQQVQKNVNQIFAPLFSDLTIQVQKYFKNDTPNSAQSPRNAEQVIIIMGEEKPTVVTAIEQDVYAFNSSPVLPVAPSIENVRNRSVTINLSAAPTPSATIAVNLIPVGSPVQEILGKPDSTSSLQPNEHKED